MNIGEVLNALLVPNAPHDFAEVFARQDDEEYKLGNIGVDTLEHNGVNAVLLNVLEKDDDTDDDNAISLVDIIVRFDIIFRFPEVTEIIPEDSPVYICFPTGEREEVKSINFGGNEVYFEF